MSASARESFRGKCVKSKNEKKRKNIISFFFFVRLLVFFGSAVRANVKPLSLASDKAAARASKALPDAPADETYAQTKKQAADEEDEEEDL